MSEYDTEVNEWTHWAKHVLIELKRLDEDIRLAHSKIDRVREDIVILKFKAGMLGAFCGAIPAILTLLTQWYLKSH